MDLNEPREIPVSLVLEAENRIEPKLLTLYIHQYLIESVKPTN